MYQNHDKGRRGFLRNSLLLTAAGLIAPHLISASKSFTPAVAATVPDPADSGPFTLPALPYSYAALEPYIDAQTMQIHHDKHHAAYVSNLNKAIAESKIDTAISLDDLVKNASKYSVAVRNNGGGHWNHSFFWKVMKPGGGGKPTGKVADAINAAFSSFDNMKVKFDEAGAKRFGSGWAWLYADKQGKLQIGSSPNQDNPLMDLSDIKGTPILGLDVWEHAYYLKYQNKRADYMNAWWNLVNWDDVALNFDSVK
jgi:Fe-Mn family superoxide dismutase